jgi:glutamyl-tRNA reductase
LAGIHGIPPDAFAPHLYRFRDAEAVEHLFLVAASVDSMVPGETQILGQVKDSYQLARQCGMTGRLFEPLFQNALSAAKEAHTLTGISRRKLSVGSVAVEFAEKIFSGPEGRTVLLVGAGEMGELTLQSMFDSGLKSIRVANRTFEKAEALAARYGGRAVPFEPLAESLAEADIVIASTAAPGFVIHADQVRQALKRRRYEPMFFIDIAVPRNIDPAVNDIDNVYLYDIDDLERVVAENWAEREKELRHCRGLIADRVAAFQGEVRVMDAGPLIAGIKKKADEIRDLELQRVFNKLGRLDDKERQEIEYLANRIVNKLLNSPISAIRKEMASGDSFRILHAAERLFDLDEEEESEQPRDETGSD